MKQCTGKVEKKLKLDQYQKPYIPHITSNRTLMYLMANNRINEWKPKRFYITYDCETVCENLGINEKLSVDETLNQLSDLKEETGKSSRIEAKLHMLSSAFTTKLEDEVVETKYFDIRTDNFIYEFMERMFEYAEEVRKANYIEDFPDDFQNNTVPVIGYNSNKFDMNMFLPFLSKR